MEVLKTIYRSLVESHFRYGNIMWGTCGEVLLTKLQKMQNRAARIITKSDYDTDAGPLIDKLGWKTIRELNNNDAAVMMFKILSNMAPPYLTGMFQPLRELHEIMLRDTNSNLRLPRMSTNMGQRASLNMALTSGTKLNKTIRREPHFNHSNGICPIHDAACILRYIMPAVEICQSKFRSAGK